MTAATILIPTLNFFVWLLESAFHAKNYTTSGGGGGADDFFHSYSNTGDSSNDGGGHTNAHDAAHNAKLQEAYRFMELDPSSSSSSSSTLDMAHIRKQWKRLSLRYHPDRNAGSDDSHALQQKLNEAFNCIQEALESGGGENEHGDDAKDAEEDGNSQGESGPTTNEETNSYTYEPPQPQKRNNRRGRTKQAQKSRFNRRKHNKMDEEFRNQRRDADRKNQEANRRRQEELRKEMRDEMKEERKRAKEERRKLDDAQDRIRRETSRLGDFEQRQAANRLFVSEVKKEMAKRKERRRRSSTGGGNARDEAEVKPKHYVMESCTNELVVAMRLGMDELALKVLDAHIAELIQEKLGNPHFMMRLEQQFGRKNLNPYLIMEYMNEVAIIETLSQRLDDDQNTLLHYAVYWERPIMIRIFCEMAQQYKHLPEIFLMKNSHGYIAMDLASIARDLSIQSLMQSQNELVKLYREQTQLAPALAKMGRTLLGGISKLDGVTTINTVLAYLVGRWAFQLHWSISLVGVGLLQTPQSLDGSNFNDINRPLSQSDRMASVATFVSLLTCTKTLWWLLQTVFVRARVILELLLVLCPVCLLCCGFERAIFASVEAPLFVFGFLSTTLFYVLPIQGMERFFHSASFPTPKQGLAVFRLLRARPAVAETGVLLLVMTATLFIQQVFVLL